MNAKLERGYSSCFSVGNYFRQAWIYASTNWTPCPLQQLYTLKNTTSKLSRIPPEPISQITPYIYISGKMAK